MSENDDGLYYGDTIDGMDLSALIEDTLASDELVIEDIERMAFGDMYADSPSQPSRPRVLLVDDEPYVLRAIGRLLRTLDVDVVTASDGKEALEYFESGEQVSLLISDEFMPGMSGTELLEIVQERSPSTVRVMITGNNDLSTAVAAINRGDVFRFVTKPWKNDELVSIAELGLEQYQIQRSHELYQRFIQQQNERLKSINEELEKRVRSRTSELMESRSRIADLYSKLESSFDGTLDVMLSIMELGEIDVVEHCRRTSARVNEFSDQLGLSKRISSQLSRAALLHWIGLINAPSTLFEKELDALGMEERAVWEFHPLLGHQVLDRVPALRRPGHIILHYLRSYDDERFRAGQVAEGLDSPLDDELVLSCRILYLCSSFEYARTMLSRRGETSDRVLMERGLMEVRRGKGTRFAPELVEPFIETIQSRFHQQRIEITITRVEDLRAGMVLSRPLSTSQGLSVAPRDLVLTGEFIERLKLFESTAGLDSIRVWG